MNHAQPSLTRAFCLLMAIAMPILVGGCQLADVARFTYANATATHQWANTQRTTAVPFRLVDNHIILPVSVNGSEPLDFVLDSGAGATVIIDSRATRALQLEMAGELPVSGTGTGPDPVAFIVPDTSLKLGELSLDGQSAIFLALDSIPFFDDLDHVYFDGVIGASFFKRFAIEIDYDRGLVSFTEPSMAAERLAGPGGDWTEVPLEIESGVPYMTARIDARQGSPVEVKLLVDTGFRGALSLTPSTSDGLREPVEYFRSVSDGLSGEVQSRVASVDSVSFAGYSLHELPAAYAMAGGESENGSNGILGNEALRQFNVVFDYARDRLLLAPNRHFSTPIEADRSGLQVRPHTAGGIVKRIAPGSSGQASPLQVGDIITAFDDTPVTHQSIRELKRVLSSERASVHLCWQTDGAHQCGELALATRFGVKPAAL